jgi:hypothetical protein
MTSGSANRSASSSESRLGAIVSARPVTWTEGTVSLCRNRSACCGMVLVNPPTMMANSNGNGAGLQSRSAASRPVRAAP